MSETAREALSVQSVETIRTSDGAFVVDLDQRIQDWMPSAQQLLGLGPDEVFGRACYEVIGGRDGSAHPICRRNCPVVVNARRGRPTPDYDVLSTRADGTPVWLNMSIVVLNGDEGRPAKVLHLFRDVTARRKLEERAQRVLTVLRDVVDEAKSGRNGDSGPLDDGLPETPVPQLSRREAQVLRLLAVGLTTGQIADSLAVSPITARNHISRLLTKLGVQSRLQAVVYASQRGLV